MSITAIVENDTIKLPMHVPDGTRVEITLPEEAGAPLPDWLQRSVGTATSGLSTDEIMRMTRKLPLVAATGRAITQGEIDDALDAD